MNRNSIDRSRVNHHGQCPGKGGGLERLEILLTDHLWREVGWGAILTSPRGTIGEIMLRASTYVETVNMIRIIALITLDLCCHHLGIDDSILAKALIHTGPTGVTTQVYHRVINPGTVGCTTLVSRNLCTFESQIGIECSAQINRLREECATFRIGNTMIVIETIDIRDAQILHRLLLDQTDPLLPIVERGCTGTWSIED